MSMGTIVVNVGLVESDVLEFYAKDEYNSFMEQLNKMDMSLFAFANYYAYDDDTYFDDPDTDELDELVKRMENLEQKFNVESGLSLCVGASDDGDDYDDIDSQTGFWCIEGTVVESPASIALKANGLTYTNSSYSLYG